MPFDPKSYIASGEGEKPKAAFDPKAYAADLPSQPKTTSQGESGLRGFVQGVTTGLADEGYGVVGAVLNPTDSDKPFWDRYRESRDYARGRDAKAKVDNPKTSTLSEVGGGVTSAFIPGVGPATVVKSGKVAEAAVKGAAMGGVAGLGYSTADVTKGEVPEALADAGTGAAIGGVSGAAIQGLVNRLSPAALRYVAERRAFKAATGNQGKVYEEAAAKGVINDRGRKLLDEGIVSFGSSAKNISEKAAARKVEVGKEIGAVLKEIDDAAPGLVSGPRIAEKISKYADSIEGQGNKALVERLHNEAEGFAAMGDVTLTEAMKHKNSYQYRAGDPSTMGLGPKVANKMKSMITDEMDGAVEAFARANAFNKADLFSSVQTGSGQEVRSIPLQGRLETVLREATDAGESQGARYKDLRSSYGTMAATEKSAGKLALQHEKNKTVSLKDAVLSAAGGAALGPKGLALGAVNNLARMRGSSTAAATLDGVANIIERTATGLDNISLGKEAPTLLEAVKRGNKALALTIFALSRKQDADANVRATHMALMNDPEYQKIIAGAGQANAIQRRSQGGTK